jgi:hypothetical protein
MNGYSGEAAEQTDRLPDFKKKRGGAFTNPFAAEI